MTDIDYLNQIINQYSKALMIDSYFRPESYLPAGKGEIKKAIKQTLTIIMQNENINWESVSALTLCFSFLSSFINDEEAKIYTDILNKGFERMNEYEKKILLKKLELINNESMSLTDEIHEYLKKFSEGKEWVKKIEKELNK